MPGELHKILGVLLLKPLYLIRLTKLNVGVLPYRLQLAKTRFRFAGHLYDQVLAHQAVQYCYQLALPDPLVNAHALRCPQRPRPGKDGEPAKHGCFIGSEQLIAPIYRGLERPMPRLCLPLTQHQHLEALAQPL